MVMPKPMDNRAQIKRALAQSTYITAAWNWFMILAGKAAEPVLVASVLYASVKLLPIVHFAPQFDVVVFIAQFVALDIGGLSLNKLADQAKQDGNEQGATHAKRLSLALVGVMLIGVIMAGVDQIIKLEGQVNTVIDTILLIARAVMAVLYSRVIHSLRRDEPETASEAEIDAVVSEKVDAVFQASLTTLRQAIVSQLEATLAQRLAMSELKQDSAMAQMRDEQISLITEAVTSMVEAAVRNHVAVSSERVLPPKVRSLAEAASRKLANGGSQEIDKVIWPLLDAGHSVRAIAAQTTISAGRVGRSRKRWKVTRGVSSSNLETPAQPETAQRIV